MLRSRRFDLIASQERERLKSTGRIEEPHPLYREPITPDFAVGGWVIAAGVEPSTHNNLHFSDFNDNRLCYIVVTRLLKLLTHHA